VTSRPRRKRHAPQGECWCEQYHDERDDHRQMPPTAEAVHIDLEAVIGMAKILQARYAHAYDHAYRGSVGPIGIIGGPSGREREGGSPARVFADRAKQDQRAALRSAAKFIPEAYDKLNAMFTAVKKVYDGKVPVQVVQPIQLRKGNYYVKALEAQERRQERGEE
jgi:hypothetical protein